LVLAQRKVLLLAADEFEGALLRCAVPEQRRSMIWMGGWIQMASARSSNATRMWGYGVDRLTDTNSR